MGTRSLTVFKDESKKEIGVMYRQYDGYPTGHGKELGEFLKDMTIVDGIPLRSDHPIANGMGCLAAQVIGHFKGETPGGIYLYPPKSRDCGEEYIYFLSPGVNGAIDLTVKAGRQVLFKGDIREFNPKAAEAKANR